MHASTFAGAPAEKTREPQDRNAESATRRPTGLKGSKATAGPAEGAPPRCVPGGRKQHLGNSKSNIILLPLQSDVARADGSAGRRPRQNELFRPGIREVDPRSQAICLWLFAFRGEKPLAERVSPAKEILGSEIDLPAIPWGPTRPDAAGHSLTSPKVAVKDFGNRIPDDHARQP